MSMNQPTVFLTTDGKRVNVTLPEVLAGMEKSNTKFFGLNIETIVALKKEYHLKGGKEPITVESIKETFNK